MVSLDEGRDGRRQLLLLGGAAVVLAVVLSLLWYLFVHTPYAPAFTQLKTDDAALIVEELKKQKTPFELSDGGATIKVPQDQVDAVRLAILGGGLPLKGTVGFELFNKSDMGLTEFAQKINYQRALQGELARTLMSLDNIESARVHITLPEDGVFRDDQRPAKASVTLAPKLGATIDLRTIVGIQRLVASAVEGLDAMNVVVLDEAGRQLSGDFVPGGAEAAETGQSPLERAYSDRIRASIAEAVRDPDMRIVVTAPAGAAMAPQTPPKVAGTAPTPSDGSSVAVRDFPLHISIQLSRVPEPFLKGLVAPLLKGSIGYDEGRGDSLEIGAQPGVSPYDVNAPVATATGRAPKVGFENSGMAPSTVLIAILAAAVMACFAAIAFIGRRKRRLGPVEREEFAARLRDLLAQDEVGHGRI